MKKAYLAVTFLMVLIMLAISGVAYAAQELPDVLGDTGGWLAAAFEAAMGGNWKYLAALVLIGMTVVFRRYGKKWVPFFATATGGVVSVMLMAAVGSFGLALAVPGATVGWGMLIGAGKLALVAGGGFSGIKQLLIPLFKWAWGKMKGLFA